MQVKAIAETHNFPPDFPSAEIAAGLLGAYLSHPGFYAVVAVQDGRVVGSNFVDERSAIAGIGPVTVVPDVQDQAVGRRLMRNVMERADEHGFAGTRLVQVAYHNRSLCLYTKLGFDVRESLCTMQGPSMAIEIPGHAVRPATTDDVAACDGLSRRLLGYGRGREVSDAVTQDMATVVEHDGRITGYATPVAFFGHAVGETNADLKALIGAAPEFPGPGFLLPSRNAEVLRWCLDHDLRLVHQTIMMTTGLYNEPTGAYLPSIQ